MNISRRFFIAGAAAFGAFGGNRFFEAFAGVAPTKKPNLKFGVISDIHISCVGADQKMEGWGNYLTFKHTLEWFRDQGVDAVLVAGDMADYGMVKELKAVAQAWFEVFPDNKAPDGRTVEKLFQMGNHDFFGYHYGNRARWNHSQEAPKTDYKDWCRENLLQSDVARFWKEIFHEDYSILQVKNVKGYTFISHHWDDGKGLDLTRGHREVNFGARLQAYLDANGKALDPKKPFFYYQHPHPKDTCYGSWAWGHDNGTSTAALTPYANAIAFSGHSHYSLTDERSVWQDAFTSVGTSSLRYTTLPYNARHPIAYENSTTEVNTGVNNALKVMGDYHSCGDCRQGMLWNIYDDCIVVQRREFLSNLFVGPDWVMPLTTAEDKPFAFATRAKKAKVPQFAADAKATLKKVQAKTRRSVQKEAYEITFPAALAEKGARPHEYEVTAHGADGKTADFYVMAEGFNHALSHKRATANSMIRIACDRLPAGTTHFIVKPLDSWWNKGKELIVKV